MKKTLVILALSACASYAEDFTLSTYFTDAESVKHVTIDAVQNKTQSAAKSDNDGITDANYAAYNTGTSFAIYTGQLLSSTTTEFSGLTPITVSSITMLSRPDGGDTGSDRTLTVKVNGNTYTSSGQVYTAGTGTSTYGTIKYSFENDLIQMLPGSSMSVVISGAKTGLGVVKGQNAGITDFSEWQAAVTLNCSSGVETPISHQDLTTVVGGKPTSANSLAFNFIITSEEDAKDGGIIAAYYSNIDADAKGGYTSNAFYLTKIGDNVYLSAGDGHMDSADKNAPTKFTVDGSRGVTLNTAALEVGVEYTIVTTTSSDNDNSQTVNLYKGTELLASRTYNGFMNGNVGVGTEMTVYTNNVYATPEPATATLSLLALAGLAARRKRH